MNVIMNGAGQMCQEVCRVLGPEHRRGLGVTAEG